MSANSSSFLAFCSTMTMVLPCLCCSSYAVQRRLSMSSRVVTFGLNGRAGTMTEVVREPLQVPSFDGHRVGAFLHRPARTAAPGLVMIPEIFGINLPLREIAARYAS